MVVFVPIDKNKGCSLPLKGLVDIGRSESRPETDRKAPALSLKQSVANNISFQLPYSFVMSGEYCIEVGVAT